MKWGEMVLAVYGLHYFQNFQLPPVSQERCSMVISRELFGISRDVTLTLEVLDGEWSFLESKEYSIQREKEVFFLHKLRENQVLILNTREDERLLLIAERRGECIPVYEKLSLSKETEISIGSNPDNRICYQRSGLVSRFHARLERINKKDWILRDVGSSNGSYVNHIRIRNDFKQLEFGDEINIYGLHLVCLGEILALRIPDEGAILTHTLEKADEKRIKWVSNLQLFTLGQKERTKFYNCPTRKMPMYEIDTVEIDGPPAPKTTGERSLLLTIGPSLTMAVPMLAGVIITGMGALGVGLFTLVGSAAIGAFWAYMNLNAQKKRTREEEERRFQMYSQYLKEKEAEIKEKYQRNLNEMQEQYPEAAVCVSYDTSCGRLWNRNDSQSDFLFCRLGLGDSESPFAISIPKEHFTLIHDTLAGEPARIRDTYQVMKQAPVGVDLEGLKLLGIIGGSELGEAYRILRVLLTQLAANVNYLDLKMAFLCDAREREQKRLLDLVKWLPHIWETSDGEENQFRYAAGDAESAAEVLKRIGQVIRARKEKSENTHAPLPRYILFVLKPEFLRDTAAEKELLDNSPYLGITTVICTENFQQLPNTCSVYIEKESQIVSVSQEMRSSKSFTLDKLEHQCLNQFAHDLAAVQVRRMGYSERLRSLVTFLDLYGVRSLEELKSEERWKTSRIYKSMRVPFGLKEGNSICYLDIHDGSEAGSQGDGPHGLVAGTTGSGKSETLQTILLSLALNFSPEDLSFFIIDYKGGGMGNLFTHLPHMQGQISNLSGRDIDRALVSLRSELTRRQRIFEENGVTKIDTYIRRYKNREILDPMPHLVLVIDEFAELKKEKPEFIREVVRIATIGRSLGVHLILSTQKPGGIVDETISSNMNFRLCLRVATLQDSRDMLRRDDAVYISTAQTGRGYLKVGEGQVYELFQSAWSGAAFGGAGGETEELARMYKITGETVLVGNHQRMQRQRMERRAWMEQLLEILDQVLKKEEITLEGCMGSAGDTQNVCRGFYRSFQEAGILYPENPANTAKLCSLLRAVFECRQNAPEAEPEEQVELLLQRAIRGGAKFPEKKEKTQLDAVVEYLAELGERTGQQYKHKLWLPVLPQIIPLSSIGRYQKYAFEGGWKERTQEAGNLGAVVGIFDDPENQQQNPLVLDLAGNGHWAIYGAVGSGKSTFLQTMLYSLLTSYNPDELWIYGIDYSSRMMEAFTEAPGMGDVIGEHEPQKLKRFFRKIETLLQERKKVLAGGSYVQFVRSHKGRLPAVAVVLDQYGAFREKTGDQYHSNILQLVKEGPACGIYLILTAGGVGSGELPSSIADQIRGNISLAMNDKYQYYQVLKCEKSEVVPDERYRGRGLAVIFGRTLEFQTALAAAGDDYQRMELIKDKCRQMAQAWKKEGASPVPEIPEKPLYSQFVELPRVKELLADAYSLPLGYDLDSGEISALDLRTFFCYLVLGRRRTGKSNFLQVVTQLASRKGGKICVIDRGGKRKRLAQETGAVYLETPEQILEYFHELMPVIQERNRRKAALTGEGLEEAEIYREMADYENIFIFISNLQDFLEILYDPDEDAPNMNGFFETLVKKGRMHRIYLFAEYGLEDGYYCRDKEFFREFVKEGTGILFGGMAADQDYLDFSSLGSLAERSRAQKPGIGWTVQGGSMMPPGKVVVPLAGK